LLALLGVIVTFNFFLSPTFKLDIVCILTFVTFTTLFPLTLSLNTVAVFVFAAKLLNEILSIAIKIIIATINLELLFLIFFI